jgi:4-amino-4-deoxy-L-arabinose transferase-like glycosyltransferase
MPVAGRQPSTRLKLIVFAVVIVAGLSTHIPQMKISLWLDEAWVANSIVAPTFSRMLYYDRWVQSTPPLFLTLSRLVTSVFGSSEVALRAVAWLAGAASVVIMAGVLRRMFSPILALFGTTLLLTNYYAGSYAQQVKQYSTDLLASVVFFALIWKCLEHPEAGPRFRAGVD